MSGYKFGLNARFAHSRFIFLVLLCDSACVCMCLYFNENILAVSPYTYDKKYDGRSLTFGSERKLSLKICLSLILRQFSRSLNLNENQRENFFPK